MGSLILSISIPWLQVLIFISDLLLSSNYDLVYTSFCATSPTPLFLIWLAKMLHIWSASVQIDRKLASFVVVTSGREWKMRGTLLSLDYLHSFWVTCNFSKKMPSWLKNTYMWVLKWFFLLNTIYQNILFFYLMEAWNWIPLLCWKSHPKLFASNQVFVLSCSGLTDSLTCI